MVTVGMYYDVLAGQGATFQAKFETVVEALRGATGHKSSFLYQRVDDPDSYAIISEWDDTDAFLGFIRSEAFREVTAWGRANVLKNAPRHKIYPRSEEIGRPT
jgi:heme-degrading monooxygenase HmoA